MQSIIHDLKGLGEKQGVRLYLRCDDEVVVLGDGALLARALSNLIENGIQYNREGGQVTVTITQDQNEKEACISVVDTGIGIPPRSQQRIFDRFYRVDGSRSRHKGGAGLGLYIANHVVEMHGGSIHVESAPGSGSTFTVSIPVSEAA